MQAQTGTLENMTVEQKQVKIEIEKYLFEELKESKERWTDWTILRFCRARKFDVVKVKEMIKKNVDFINKINLERLQQVDHDVYKPLQEVTWNGYCNTDKQGRPVYIEFARGLKAKECFSRFTDDELVDYYIQSYERMVNIAFPEASKQAGKRIDRTLTIIDLKDVSLFKMFTGKTKAFVNLGTTITQDNYPELMGQTFIINTGYFFSGIWTIVKGWLDPVTRQKIKIISGSGKKELLEAVDEDKLPVELGGTFKGDIRDNHGPWKEALEKSYKNKTFQHHDKKLYAQYFLTEQQKK